MASIFGIWGLLIVTYYHKHILATLVHGVVHDTLDFCRSILQVELNSATDNPMILAHRDCTIRYFSLPKSLLVPWSPGAGLTVNDLWTSCDLEF